MHSRLQKWEQFTETVIEPRGTNFVKTCIFFPDLQYAFDLILPSAIQFQVKGFCYGLIIVSSFDMMTYKKK